MSDFMIQDGQTVIMQGDSITDAGRRGEQAPFGGGYVAIFREMVTALYPERDITIINKGIGGERTTGLRERWDDDVIRHQPDWLTVMIGINDLHGYLRSPDAEDAVSVDTYRENYDWLLQRTKSESDARIVLIDPFYVSISPEDTFRSKVLEVIVEYVGVVHEMADKYDALLVPMHDIFARHLIYRQSEQFCPEPVHPDRAGHIAIAVELLKTLDGI